MCIRDSVNIEHPDFEKALTGDIKGLKIGVPTEYMGAGISEAVTGAVTAALGNMKAAGADYSEMSLPLKEYALPAYYMISSAEASSNLARYDGVKYGYRAEKFSDLVDMYCQTRSEGFGTEVKRRIMIGTYALSSGYYDAYYKKAQQVRTLIMNDFNKAFETYDVLVTPATPTTAFQIGEKTCLLYTSVSRRGIFTAGYAGGWRTTRRGWGIYRRHSAKSRKQHKAVDKSAHKSHRPAWEHR